KAMLMALLCRVEIRSDCIEITLSRCRLTQLLARSIDLSTQHRGPTNAPGDMLMLTVPVSLKRVGREMRMLVENAEDQTAADPSLLRIMARAHAIQARLIVARNLDSTLRILSACFKCRPKRLMLPR